MSVSDNLEKLDAHERMIFLANAIISPVCNVIIMSLMLIMLMLWGVNNDLMNKLYAEVRLHRQEYQMTRPGESRTFVVPGSSKERNLESLRNILGLGNNG